VNGLTAEASWRLVAPWFRWGAEGVGTGGMTVRDTWPAFQKYATANPAGEFVKKPQHSLKFLESEDRYEFPHALPALGQINGLAGVLRRLSDTELLPTPIRKLYLDTHRRFYLVVVQLIRDEPGYPCVDRANVCQQGFVVRRRSFSVDKSAIDSHTAGIFHSVAMERARNQQMTRFNEFLTSPDTNVRSAAWSAVTADDLVALAGVRAEIRSSLAREQRRMLAWAVEAGVGVVVERWEPGPHKNIGKWQSVTDPPDAPEETYPLYPLVADPDDTQHDGHNASIYFGLVPTGGSDVEDSGRARFDDQSLYEISCFVRRHDKRCPRSDKVPDCQGPLVWSAASETYRLAAQFDLTGTSNHAITVQAPDMPALAAKVAALAKKNPAGKTNAAAVAGGGVRVVTPPNSSISLSAFPAPAGIPTSGGPGGAAEVCFFMIPFFTIIALFLVSLALPILTIMLGMGWMLALKLCIPPDAGADVSVDMQAELDLLAKPVINGGFGVDTSLDIDDQLTSPTDHTQNDNFRSGLLLTNLTAELGTTAAATQMQSKYSTDAFIRLHQAMGAVQTALVTPSLKARLQFEDDPNPVVRSEVVMV